MVSPSLMSNDTLLTACIVPPESRKSTARSRTERSSLMTGFPDVGLSVSSSSFSGGLLFRGDSGRFSNRSRPWQRPDGLPRVEGIAHRLADEDQQAQHDAEREERRQAEPRRLKVALALSQPLTQRRRSRRQAEA